MPDDTKEPSALVIPFGKHKGTTVAELLAKDPAYADWITTQGWVAERFAELHAAILTRGAGTDDTPEHNAIQVRFLDRMFQRAFLGIVAADRLEERRRKRLANWMNHARHDDEKAVTYLTSSIERAQGELTRGYWSPPNQPARTEEWLVGWRELREASIEKERAAIVQHRQNLAGVVEPAISLRMTVEFENRGIDVGLSWVWVIDESHPDPDYYGGKARIEIKPSMGDDYPSVMRQMSRLGAAYLLVGEYNGRGAAFPQVRQMFAANHQVVVLLREVETELPAARALVGGSNG